MAGERAASSFMLNVHAAPDFAQAAFLRRAMSALERISSSMPAKTLTDALSAPTDAGSLAQLLTRADLVGSAVIALDPLVPALARNVEHRKRLLGLAGSALSANEAGDLLGITRQAIDKRRRSNNPARHQASERLALSRLSNSRMVTSLRGYRRLFEGLPQQVHGPRSTSCWPPTRCLAGEARCRL